MGRYDFNNRRAIRRTIAGEGRVLLPNGVVLEVVVRDVSQTGAQLELLTFEDVPDYFTLEMAANIPVVRKCKMVWQDAEMIGVMFPDRQPKYPPRRQVI
ncbi:PilZ domain-containing protein [Flaviflagellibacter deserti]|uniref:PilZ domain-containing protein n=1 Tax=Flaviflagellibacter deserti TaxID=2267266 RepID=A0ABV9Z4B7_9HYPH